MKRVLILGSSGSGKTTLARQLAKILSLPAIHLDSHFWLPNWIESSAEEWQAKLNILLEEPTWIMEGCYTKSLPQRIELADTIVYIDLNRFVCLWRCIKRYFKHRNKVRDDLPAGCYEKIDWDFFKWIWNFPKNKRPVIYDLVNSMSKEKKLIIVRNKHDLFQFINKISGGSRI